ncbi:hypothetical protein OsI_28987 [Oryza sativa Indica Group]|uniref:Uncharacterized protein n=1 Tax=Oryza sativa subsp. indica TaxID=39946 RepID=B8BA80_ORYSI|nr:hypothetical protein OsI_28987 [Oryza sativa Indica Group]
MCAPIILTTHLDINQRMQIVEIHIIAGGRTQDGGKQVQNESPQELLFIMQRKQQFLAHACTKSIADKIWMVQGPDLFYNFTVGTTKLNRACKLKKTGLRPTQQPQRAATTTVEESDPISPEAQSQPHFPTHDQLLTQIPNAMVSQMFDESSQVSQMNLAPGPLPDNQFVMTNTPTVRPTLLTTATKAGKARATKRKAAVVAPAKKATKKR